MCFHFFQLLFFYPLEQASKKVRLTSLTTRWRRNSFQKVCAHLSNEYYLISPSPQRNAKNALQNLEGNTTWITIQLHKIENIPHPISKWMACEWMACECHSFISAFYFLWRGFVHIGIKHCWSNSPTVFHKEQIPGTDVYCLLNFICIVISKIRVYYKHKHTKTCSLVKWGQDSSKQQGFLKHKSDNLLFYLYLACHFT